MEDSQKDSQVSSKIKTAQEVPVFSDAQANTFYSDTVDSLDEALAVLDETNRAVVGHTRSFKVNRKEHSGDQ